MSIPTSQLKSKIIRAGAGAGKTTALTNEVLQFAQTFRQNNGRWPRVVVCTFTRKATQELRERLIKRATESKDWELLRYCSSQQLLISTIHGVLHQFLIGQLGRLELDGGFDILSESSAQELAKKTCRQVLKNNPSFAQLLDHYPLTRLLEMSQQFYSKYTENPRLRAISLNEHLELIREQYSNLLRELEAAEERIQSGLSDAFQSYVDRFKRVLKGRLENDDSTSFENAVDYLGDKPRKPSKSGEDVAQLSEFLKGCKDQLIELMQEEEIAELHTEISEKFFEYAKIFSEDFLRAKIAKKSIEINDLELFAIKIFEQKPELFQDLKGAWDYWLVDEYQDTSPLQDRLIELMRENQPIFFVGDPQQSIYLFRGARFENFTEQMRGFEETNQLTEVRDRHYRSRGELLEFFNDFFSFGSDDFMRMSPARAANDSQAIVARFCVIEEGEAAEKKEYASVYQRISELLQAGVRPQQIAVLSRTNFHLEELAAYLTARGVPTQVHAKGGFARRREILDLGEFLRFLINPHDDLNLLCLLRSPWLKVQDQDIADWVSQKKETGREKEKVISFWTWLSERDHKVICKLNSFLALRDQLPLSSIVKNYFLYEGVLIYSYRIDPSGRSEANLWKWYSQLKAAERKPGFKYLDWLRDQNTFVSLEDGNEGDAVSALEPNRVQFMTIHGAKGLEFDHVILPFCHQRPQRCSVSDLTVIERDNLFCLKVPLKDKMSAPVSTILARRLLAENQAREEKEAKRLLYVAMTRAKESVWLSWREPFGGGSWAEDLSEWLKAQSSIDQNLLPYSFSVERPDDGGSEVEVSNEALVEASLIQDSQAEVSISIEATTQNAVDLSANFSQQNIASSLFGHAVADTTTENSSAVLSKHSLLERWAKMRRGVELHRLCEQLKYSSSSGEDIDKVLASSHLPGDEIEGLRWMLNLQSPPMRDLFQSGFAEWGFSFAAENSVIDGQIDLWGRASDAERNTLCWVIDYKTGRIESLEKTFEQLTIYAKALRAFGVNETIYMAALYLLEQKVFIRQFESSHLSVEQQLQR